MPICVFHVLVAVGLKFWSILGLSLNVFGLRSMDLRQEVHTWLELDLCLKVREASRNEEPGVSEMVGRFP